MSEPRHKWLDCPEGALALEMTASTSAGEGRRGPRVSSRPSSSEGQSLPPLGSLQKELLAHILLLHCLVSHSGHGHRDCLCGGCRRRDPDEHHVLGLREEKVRSAVTPPGHWAATESALLPINESHPRVHNWLKMFWFCFSCNQSRWPQGRFD